MTNFYSFNELRINNIFLDHKGQYKYTFENSRGHRSTRDYTVINRKIHPTQIVDVRTLNSAYVGSEHKTNSKNNSAMEDTGQMENWHNDIYVLKKDIKNG